MTEIAMTGKSLSCRRCINRKKLKAKKSKRLLIYIIDTKHIITIILHNYIEQ